MAEPTPIDRALFREAEDGSTVYFPWGLAHRGYRLTDPASRKKASRAASGLVGATVAIGSWTAHALQPLLASDGIGPAAILRAVAVPGGAFLLALVAYWLWAVRFVEGLAESDLEVSREQRLREAAALVGPGRVALIGIVVCLLGALVVWLQPRAWWLGSLGAATGAGLLFWSVLIRRAGAAPPR